VSFGARYLLSPPHLARSETRHYTPRMQWVSSRREFVGALATGAAGLAVAGRYAPPEPSSEGFCEPLFS